MSRCPRIFAALLALSAMVAFAERPPPRAHAGPEFLDGAGGGEPLSAGARFVATLPFATREALRKEGHAVLDEKSKDESGGMVRAVIRFERPRDEVFAIVTQPSQQISYLPHVTQSKTVGTRTAEGESIDMVVSVFVFTFKYRVQHWFYPDEHRMEWSLDPAGADGLKDQTGYMQLYALDDKTTIVEYGTRVVARSAIINFVRGLGERGGVAEALGTLRKHVAASKL